MMDTTTDSRRAVLLRQANALTGRIHEVYPERPEPQPHVPVRNVIMELLSKGVNPDRLLDAAIGYAIECEQEKIPLKFRIGSVRFYRDGIWTRHAEVRVYGLTREEWRQSGQDLLRFDQLHRERNPAVEGRD